MKIKIYNDNNELLDEKDFTINESEMLFATYQLGKLDATPVRLYPVQEEGYSGTKQYQFIQEFMEKAAQYFVRDYMKKLQKGDIQLVKYKEEKLNKEKF